MRHDLAEAEKLAARIRAYWQGRGLSASVWVEQRLVAASAADAERRVPVICSDLVGGWPYRPPVPAGRQSTVCPVCRHWLPNGFSGLSGRPPAANTARPVSDSPERKKPVYSLPRVSGDSHG
jgi:hypothetical protein